MPYLDEAARQLGISEKTLRRWLKLLDPPIEPTKDRRNLRFKFIADDDVERIRQERASVAALIGAQSPAPGKRQNTPVARSRPNLGEQPGGSDRFIVSTRQKRLTSTPTSGLPEGWMSQKRAADEHGIAYQTLREWCRKGYIETDPAPHPLGHGYWEPVRPITQRGLAQLVAYARAHQPQKFHVCDLCPHAEQIAEQLAEESR